MEVNFDAAVIIAAIIFIWMFVELIGHSCVQKPEENNWKKWCDFFSNFRIISVVALVVVSSKINSMAQYFIYGPIVAYDIVFLIKYKFNFKTF
jgi:fumarate reductase subunit C